MAKQYVVARGQIEKGKEVLAKQGETYKPRNAAEEKRLVEAGVLTEVEGRAKAAKPADPQPPAGGAGEGGEGAGDTSQGDGAGEGEGGQGNA